VTIKISSEISFSDIPLLRQNDKSIYRRKIAPFITNSDYKQWITTQGVNVVTARYKEEIIGQLWVHPLKLYKNNEPINNHLYWVHNIKIHPKWQNKGVYRKITHYYEQNIFSRDDQRLLLVNASNARMRYLASKTHFFPIMLVPGSILFRYYFSSKITKNFPLRVVNSQVPPEFWKLSILKQHKYWIPRFSWDKSPEWFSFYFEDELICVLQIIRPVHPVQGRSISKFTIKLHTRQVRYFSLTPSFLQLQPSLVRSIFNRLFSFFPKVNAFILTMNPKTLTRLLHIPGIFILSPTFILYSTIKDPELINENLDFQASVLILNSKQE
jgi:hypothetical protein